MIEWEGAELCYYVDGESYSIPLSNIQFAMIGKLLGLKTTEDSITFFSDETLKQLANMQGNPLKLVEDNR